jgi:hypothetical protein
MEEHERQLVLDQLASSRERLLGLAEGLTAAQWSFHPAEGRWSIGECLEHVLIVENRIIGMIGKKLEEEPVREKHDSSSEKDATVARLIPDRSIRRQAPEAAKPSGQWPDAQKWRAEFEKTRQRTEQFTAGTKADLRGYILPHASLGDLDCYQWLLVLSLHGSRHAQQIDEIKTDAAFPR